MTTDTKLKTGEWGVKTNLPVRLGDTLLVTRKDGSTTVEKVTEILWKYDRST